MIRDNELVGLCQVIARDSGLEVTVGGKDSFISNDGRRLNIAAMPMTPEGRMVAIGLGFHEVGHKLYTDVTSGPGNGLLGDLTNIIEDVREERDFIKDRPGAAYDLESVTDWYQSRGNFTPNNLNTAIRTLALGVGYAELLGFSSLAPDLVLAREIITAEMGGGFLSLAEMILKKYPSLSYGKDGTAESREMALALCNLLEEEAQKKEQDQQRQKQQQKQDDHQDQPSHDGSSEEVETKTDLTESEDHDDQSSQDTSDSPSESDMDEDDQNGGGDQQDDSQTQDDESGEGRGDPSGNGGSNSSPLDAESDTDQSDFTSGGQATDTETGQEEGQTSSNLSPDVIRGILHEESDFGDMQKIALKELDRMSKDVPNAVRASIPQLPMSERFYGDRNLVSESDAITATSRMRAKLMGMLQSVKKQPGRYGTSGSKLAVNRLVNMHTGDPRIFKKRVESVSINTAIVIMLDASGSMANGRMEVARDTAFALHHTLKGIGGVATLSAAFDMDTDYESVPIQVLCTWGEKPSPENFSVSPGDYTPTPLALWYARAQLLQRPEPRKICLLVTDGEPFGWDGIESDTVAATKRLEKDGIEIAAIGIELPDVATYWKNNRVVNSIEELPQAMFGVMNDLLTRKPNH